MKRVPKYIKDKICRANALMNRVVELNMEVERWAEANGADYGYELSDDYREEMGYGISQVEEYVKRIEEAIN